MHNKIRIVLVAPSHPGNIGAAARAMKTMGLSQLYIVAPRLFPHADATAMAAGADDLLARATVCDDLDAAIGDCRFAVASSTRVRSLPWPQRTPAEAARELVVESASGPVALLFGRERTGLTNEELERCQVHATIDADPDYGSLNIAAAVQVFAYELRLAMTGGAVPAPAPGDRLVTGEELEGFHAHLERALLAIDFLDPRQPGQVLRRLRRLFARARLEEAELHILRGVMRKAEQMADRLQ